MADLKGYMQPGHTVEDLDTVIDEVYEARGEYDSLDERLDDMSSGTPAPASSTPSMDGTGSAGTSNQYARADHVHPSDTSKQNALSSTQLDAVNSGIDSEKVAQIETNKNNILSIYNTGFAQKNVMHIVLDEVKAIQSWATFINNTITFGNLSVTFNDDNSITLNGSNTINVAINFKDWAHINLPTNAVGAASANITLSNDIFFGLWGDSGVPNLVLNDGVDIPSDYASKYSRGFIIRVSANTVCNNVRIYPMVCDKALYQASSEVVPYALPNTAITPALVDCVDNGKKNLYQFQDFGATAGSGTGVTLTDNGDGTFSATGTASGGNYARYLLKQASIKAGNYVITGISGGALEMYHLRVGTGSGDAHLINLENNYAQFTIASDTTVTVQFVVNNGVTVTNLSIKPMICEKSLYDISSSYQPYAMSNAELTAAIQALQAQLVNQ